MNVYHLKILTPEKMVYDDEVISMTVTCADGQLTVLAGHAPMVALLAEGSATIRTEQGTIEGTAGHGILQVENNEAAVMVHSFAWD